MLPLPGRPCDLEQLRRLRDKLIHNIDLTQGIKMHSPRVHADRRGTYNAGAFVASSGADRFGFDAWPWQLTVTRRSRTVQPIQGLSCTFCHLVFNNSTRSCMKGGIPAIEGFDYQSHSYIRNNTKPLSKSPCFSRV